MNSMLNVLNRMVYVGSPLSLFNSLHRCIGCGRLVSMRRFFVTQKIRYPPPWNRSSNSWLETHGHDREVASFGYKAYKYYYNKDLSALMDLKSNVLAQCQQMTITSSWSELILRIYTMIVSLLSRNQQLGFDYVIELSKELARLRLHGNRVVYNTLLNLCHSYEQDAALQQLLNDLLQHTHPDKFTFHILMRVAIRQSDWATLLKYMDEMHAQGIMIDGATTNVVVNALCTLKEHDLALALVHTVYRTCLAHELVGGTSHIKLISIIERRRRYSQVATLDRRERRHRTRSRRKIDLQKESDFCT